MGGHHSRPERKLNAVVNAMASTIVNSQSNCLSDAKNQVMIKFGKVTGTAIVKNVKIQQIASAQASCDFETSVEIGSILPPLQSMLDTVIQQTKGVDSKDKSSIVDNISRSVTKNMVTSCLATAVNSFSLDVGKVGGNVDIENLNMYQYAHTSIQNCLLSNNTKVGDTSLSNYITDNLGPYDINDPFGNPVVCNEAEKWTQYMYIAVGAAVIILLAFVIAAIVVGTGKSPGLNNQ